MNAEQSRPRPTLRERILLRLSEGRDVDGFWIGTIAARDSDSAVMLDRVEEALDIIRTRDPRRYSRLRRDLKRIWLRLQPASSQTGCYNRALDACELDPRHVLRNDITSSDIASIIVHEGTHARLRAFGIGFAEQLRFRIEALCRKEEHAFAERLPEAARDRIRAKLARIAALPPDYWDNTSIKHRYDSGVDEALQYLGTPRWSLPFLRLIRRLVRAIARLRAA